MVPKGRWIFRESWSNIVFSMHQWNRHFIIITASIYMTLAVAEALSPNKPNLDMTLAVAEALSPNKPNLDMTLAVAEALHP